VGAGSRAWCSCAGEGSPLESLSVLGHVLAAALTIAVFALAGRTLLTRVTPTRTEPCLFWSSALALGAGLTTILVTASAAVGIFGRATAWAIAGVVTAVAIAGLRRPIGLRFRMRALWRSMRQRRPGMIAVALLVLTTLLATLLATLAPPSSMDATVYHLRVARQFLLSGHWTELPEVVQSYQPLYVQMLFAEGLGLWDEVFAALMHWILGLGAIVAAGAWSRRLGGSALLGMAVFGLAALVTWESTSAFIDLALALFASLGLLWATMVGELDASVGLATVFAGLAAGSKLTGGVAALQTAVVAAVFKLSGSSSVSSSSSRTPTPSQSRGAAARAFGVVVAGAFALALPWYLRNVSFTGNPVFPIGNPWLGLPDRPLAFNQYGYGRDLLHLLTSPFDLVWRGDAFDKGWAIGPAYLALVPVGIAVTWSTKVGRAACALVLSWWIIWFFSSPQTRLLLPILPTAAALASAGAVAALGSPERWLRRAAVVLMGSAALLGAAFAILAVKIYGPAALGLEDREAFLTRMSWHFPAFEATNARLDPGTMNRVAVFGADNLFYLRVPAETRTELEPPAVLRARGFTHVLDIGPCGRPSRLATSSLMWRGRYRLRISRMGGGTQGEETCAELGRTALQPSDIQGGGARAAYAPFSSARSPYE
jgi:hypothetical protein